MSPPAHLVVFPYPAQGHMLPLLDFTHQLVVRFDVAVTIVITPGNLPVISALLSTHPSIQTLTLPFPSHPSIPQGAENVKDLGWRGNVFMIASLPQLAPLIRSWFYSHPDPPVAVISDLFLGWTKPLAQELGIEHFEFYGSGALFKSILLKCWKHEEIREMSEFEFSDIPGSPSFKKHELPSLFRLFEASSPDWEIVREVLAQDSYPTNFIFNSVHALESRYFDHLLKELGHDRVYAVGPVSINGLNYGKVVQDSDHSSIFDWLDSSPEGSVLYVSFGSQVFMSEEQTKGLALGLEMSGARFLWAFRAKSENCYLPTGFEERVAGRGLVLRGWAPQVRILRHEAVGGFLSHCGWNSVLEGIEAGVAFLSWPMQAEQYLNAKLLEANLGIGVRACEGVDTVPEPDELATAIRQLYGDSGKALRLRASELKDAAFAAVAEGGSSSDHLGQIGMRLKQLGAAQMRYTCPEDSLLNHKFTVRS